eukprot:TRINITY_DN61472_c0_g1_i1.p1 TRINITY_DN61472_c0_g1~~TRINITY_DN61472_c0_g1_i1.p1  ORF type:complete len:315 (+),score=87.63 TRINITY_DN61472_c0_g1_i1:94-1038(+)
MTSKPSDGGESTVNQVLDYRVDIDEEFQGWILIFASITAIWLYCLPCYCAGMSYSPARKFASWISQRLPMFYVWMTMFNALFLFLVVTWLPDWGFGQYIEVCLAAAAWTVAHMLKWATSIAIILAFAFVVAFKERFALMLGLDHKQIFNCKMRDCLTCWTSTRFQAIEVQIWKVEDLPSADLFQANNVFVEAHLGYNETMKTRVHNNAGSDCILKETIQLNFDEDDEEEKLFIFVRNQQVMGAAELARVEISTGDLKELVRKGGRNSNQIITWSQESFGEPLGLIPRGNIWLRASVVDDENFTMSSYAQDMATC